MPFAVAAAILAAEGFAVAAAIVSLVGMVVADSEARRARRRAEAQARDAFNSSREDRTINIRSATMPRNMILGRDRASGPAWPWFTWGDKKQFHTFGITWAGHECDAAEAHYFNDDLLTLDADGWVTAPLKYVKVTVTTDARNVPGQAAGATFTLEVTPDRIDHVQFQTTDGFQQQLTPTWTEGTDTFTLDTDTTGGTVYVNYTYSTNHPLFKLTVRLGAPGQTAAAELIAAAAAAGVPTEWDSTKKNTGNAYTTIQMEADFDTLSQIGLPNYSVVARGAKPYNPVTLTTEWTMNPPLLARWFMVESPFSPKTLSTEIGTDELAASIGVSDEDVDFSATRTQARYQANGQLYCNGSPLDNLLHIADAMDGDVVWVGGMWQIVAGYHRAATLTLNESQLSDAAIEVTPATPKRDLFNAVIGTYIDVPSGYVRTSYPMVTSLTYQAQDGDEVLTRQDDFELVSDPVRCQMIAWQRLQRGRQALAVNLGTNLSGYDTYPTQTVSLTLAEFGWSPKLFTVRRRSMNGTAGTLDYTLRETGSTLWDWDYSLADQPTDVPNTAFPDPNILPAPVILSTASGDAELTTGADGTMRSRIKVEVAEIANTYIHDEGWIELQYRRAVDDGDAWVSAPREPGDTQYIWLSGVIDGDTYLIRPRGVTGGGRRGPWGVIATETVIGKTEPPPDIVEFSIDGTTLSWAPVVANDLAGYVFRFHYGNNLDWGSAAALNTGFITESPYAVQNIPGGAITIMAKAVDTSGNESNATANIFTDLGDAPVANVLVTVDWDAMSYPGTLSGCTLSGGNLVATALDSFYGTDDQSFFGLDTDSFFKSSAYGEMVYTTSEVVVSAALAGSNATLAFTYQGTDLLVEYRQTGPGSFYGPDADSFYGADSDPFFDTPPGPWTAWPGVIQVSNSTYQFRFTIGAGATQGKLFTAALTIDAPDITEDIANLSISNSGTPIPYTKHFTSITTVIATLQANASSAVTLEVDKTSPLAPSAKAYNAAHTAVSGAKADFRLKGY